MPSKPFWLNFLKFSLKFFLIVYLFKLQINSNFLIKFQFYFNFNDFYKQSQFIWKKRSANFNEKFKRKLRLRKSIAFGYYLLLFLSLSYYHLLLFCFFVFVITLFITNYLFEWNVRAVHPTTTTFGLNFSEVKIIEK